MCKTGRINLKSFNGRGNGNRGGDHPVPEEQAGTEDTQSHQQGGAPNAATLDQSGERHPAAITAVVHPHQ